MGLANRKSLIWDRVFAWVSTPSNYCYLYPRYVPLLLKAGRDGAPCRTLVLQTWGYLRAVRGSRELGDFGKRHFERMNRLSIEVVH